MDRCDLGRAVKKYLLIKEQLREESPSVPEAMGQWGHLGHICTWGNREEPQVLKSMALYCLDIEKLNLEQQMRPTRNSQKGRKMKNVVSQQLMRKGRKDLIRQYNQLLQMVLKEYKLLKSREVFSFFYFDSSSTWNRTVTWQMLSNFR